MPPCKQASPGEDPLALSARVNRDRVPKGSDLTRLRDLAARQVKLDERIAVGTKLLAELAAERKHLSETLLPDAMEDVGIQSFTLASGEKIEVEAVITASLTEGGKPIAIAWLRENGHDGIVTRNIVVKLPKGQFEKGDAISKALTKLGVTPVDVLDVNTGTFKSFLKEYLTDGEMMNENGTLNERGSALPLDDFGVYVGRRANIKQPKSKG